VWHPGLALLVEEECPGSATTRSRSIGAMVGTTRISAGIFVSGGSAGLLLGRVDWRVMLATDDGQLLVAVGPVRRIHTECNE
jgi:hypothetical protein